MNQVLRFQNITPAYNDQIILLSQPTSGELFNHRYLIKTSMLNQSGFRTDEIVLRSIGVSLPENGYAETAYFNLKQLTSSNEYLSSIKGYPNSPFWQVDFYAGEEYATSANEPVTQHYGELQSYFVINGALNLNEFIDWDYEYFDADDTGSGERLRALTGHQGSRTVMRSTVNELMFFDTQSDEADRGVVKYYNGANYLTSANCATGINGLLFLVNDPLSTPAEATRYTMNTYRSSQGPGVANSPVYEFNISTGACRYTPVTVYFQNRYGMMDNFLFTMKGNRSDIIQRNTFKQLTRYMGDNERGTMAYSSNINRRHLLNTDWISESEMNELMRDLAESNLVSIDYTNEVEGGVKASIQFKFENIPSAGINTYKIDAGFSMAFYTTAENVAYTAALDSPAYADIDDLMAWLASEILDSTIGNLFGVAITGSTSTIGMLTFEALTAGVSKTINMAVAPMPDGEVTHATGYFYNNIPGQSFTGTNLIKCIPNTTDFQFKKKENENLFQLQIELMESNDFERQAR